LLLRSLRTLACRVEAQSATAQAVAQFLAADPRVRATYYPGLSDSAGSAIAQRQMASGGAMISFCVASREAAMEVAAATELFTRATSLGGVESLIEHRASIEGPDTRTPQELLRLSIGLEHRDDLIADLDQALAAAD
jgi:cystathionine gamma-synthase